MKHVDLGGQKVRYLEHGDGDQAIVFVHGFLCSSRWWEPAFEHLPSNHRGIALDLAGPGGTDRASAFDIADHVAAFVSALGLKDIVLVGHSMGGGVATCVALEHQQLLRALVLVNPISPDGSNGPDFFSNGLRAMFAALPGNRPATEGLMRGTFVRPVGDALVKMMVDDAMVATGSPALKQGLVAMASLRVRHRLAEIKVPSLAVWGDKDTWVQLDNVLHFVRGIPGCGLHVFSGVGHDTNLEVPAELMRVIGGFLVAASPRPRK